jgi:CRP/FNR family transcriptional regulator
MRALALSDSAAEKLARLLLSWRRKNGNETDQAIRLKLSLTHGEIAQMIGVSRETVTRLLGELRSKGVIQLKGSNLLIKDMAALEDMLNT